MEKLALRNSFVPPVWDKFFNDSFFNDDWFTNKELEVYNQKPGHYFYDEENNEHVIIVEAPGLSKEEINIEIDDNGIMITRERKNEQLKERLGEKKISYVLHKTGINSKDVNASFKNGILEIKFKQKEKDKISQKIAIK